MSGKQKVDSERAVQHNPPDKAAEKKVRKQRSTDIGRALRSVYDDTVREEVPDDFLNLLGKLN